jgi:uncharacterized protein YidB (DUF937 family)
MGLLDDVLKQGGGGSNLIALAAKNPQILAAVASLLSNKSDSVGGAGGLGAMMSAFGKGGLGDVMNSWIGTGQNRAIDPGQLASILGADTMGQFAHRAGVAQGDAGSILASLLPQVIDGLTPQGRVPPTPDLDVALGALLGR